MFCKYTGSDFKNMRPSTLPALFTNTSMRLKFLYASCISVSSAPVAVKSNGMHSGSRVFLCFCSLYKLSRNANSFS